MSLRCFAGNLLLVASSSAKKEHRVVRISVGGAGPDVTLAYHHPRPLVWQMLVDANGFVFYEKKPNGTLAVYQLTELHNFGGGWDAVAALL